MNREGVYHIDMQSLAALKLQQYPRSMGQQPYRVSFEPNRETCFSILCKNSIFVFNLGGNPDKSILSFNLDTREWKKIIPKGESLLSENSPFNICHFGQEKILRIGLSKPKPIQHTEATLQNYRDMIADQLQRLQQIRSQAEKGPIACEILRLNDLQVPSHNNNSSEGHSTQPLQAEWQEVKINDPKPAFTVGSTLHCVQNKLYLYGGIDTQKLSNTFDNNSSQVSELYIMNITAKNDQYTITEQSCSIPKQKDGRLMKPRSQHSSVVHRENIYYYGGRDGNLSLLFDMWTVNTRTLEWTEIKFKGLMPTPRHSLFARLAGDTIFFLREATPVYQSYIESQTVLTYNINTNTWKNTTIEDSSSSGQVRIFEIHQNMLVFGEPYNLHFADSGVKGISSHNGRDENSFRSSDQELFKERLYTDVTFNIEGQQISAHKAILATRCQHFNNLFQNKEEVSVIDISDMKINIFNGLLEYIYCGEIEDLTENIASELLKLAHKYGVSGLTEFCQKFLINTLAIENVVEITNLAYSCNASNLQEAGLLFIADNFASVSKQHDIKSLASPVLFQLFHKKLAK